MGISVMIIVPMNACKNRRDSFAVPPANGPWPRRVPNTASPERPTTTVAVSGGPKRNTAHNRVGMHMKATGALRRPAGARLPKTAQPVRRTANASKTASPGRRRSSRRSLCCRQSNRNGATTSVPTASPSHHVNQIEVYWGQVAWPPSARLATPIVALTDVLNRAAKAANLKMSCERSNAERCQRPTAGGDVHQPGAHEDRGPDAEAEEEQRGQRDPGGRPHRTRARMDGREIESQSTGSKIDRRDA